MCNESHQYKYSIVIPHYNLPLGLRSCLESIPNRPDLQVIVVDDASNEKSFEALKKLECLFHNVDFVYSKQNGYGGKARNLGLEHAKGEYVIFSDADDTFTSVFNQVLDDYKNTQTDLIFFKTNMLDETTHNPISRGHHVNDYIDLWSNDPQKAELYLRYMFGEPWCKMIKRQVIEDKNIRFDETRINNDTTFSYLVGHYCQTVAVDNRAIYNYMVRTGSTSRQNDIERLYIKINVFGRSELFFRQHHIDLHEDRQYMALSGLLKKLDFAGFKKGFLQLVDLGFKKNVIRKDYSRAMGSCKLLVPLWNILFAPDLMIKIYCLYYWFSITIPRYFKYRILGKENKELRRY